MGLPSPSIAEYVRSARSRCHLGRFNRGDAGTNYPFQATPGASLAIAHRRDTDRTRDCLLHSSPCSSSLLSLSLSTSAQLPPMVDTNTTVLSLEKPSPNTPPDTYVPVFHAFLLQTRSHVLFASRCPRSITCTTLFTRTYGEDAAYSISCHQRLV